MPRPLWALGCSVVAVGVFVWINQGNDTWLESIVTALLVLIVYVVALFVPAMFEEK